MRVAFFTLLVGNLLLAAWLMSVSPPAPPAPPPVPEDLPRLELLAERDYPEAAEPGPEGGQAPGGLPATAGLCYRAGPFETEADARRLAGALGERVVGRELQREQVETAIGHWVYLPAFPDRESAMDAARRLDVAGLGDYYVITAGDQENTISLGLYRESENADRRVRSLRNMGFDARSRVRTESMPRYHLELALAGEESPDWPALLDDHPDAGARRTDCPED